MTNNRVQRFNILRSEYVNEGVWRDKAIRKNLSEHQVRVFMRKLSGRFQSAKFVYSAEPVRRQNTSTDALFEVLNP